MSMFNPDCRSINDGCPPTTFQWNEWELRQTGPARRSYAPQTKGKTDGVALDVGATEDKEKEPDAGSDAEDASDRQAGEA